MITPDSPSLIFLPDNSSTIFREKPYSEVISISASTMEGLSVYMGGVLRPKVSVSG
jgi:hypothetical protein